MINAIVMSFLLLPGSSGAETGVKISVSSSTPESSGVAVIRELERNRLDERKNRISRLETMLKEYEDKNYSDSDKYIVLRDMLFEYKVVRGTASAEFVNTKEYLKRLSEKHPEFQQKPPSELSEQKRLRDLRVEHKKQIFEKHKNWEPRDVRYLDYLQSGKNLLIIFQYRLEFYELEVGERIGEVVDENGNKIKIEIYNARGARVSRKPQKTISFERRIVHEPIFPQKHRAVLICTDPTLGYSPRTKEEKEIVDVLRSTSAQRGYFAWRNPNADYVDFCGVISLEGEIVFKFPVRQAPPDYYVRPIGIKSDGKKALLGVGKYECSDESCGLYNYFALLYWEAPDNFKEVGLKKENAAQIESIKKEFGLQNSAAGKY